MKAQNIIVVIRNTFAICMVALIGTVQAWAVEYKNSYQQSVVSNQFSAVGYQEATAPSATFQSTSAYSSQWNQEDRQSMLNADGSMNTDAYMSSGPRRAPGGGPGSSPGTPGGELDPSTQQPLGDAALPLMLLACAYAIYMVSRRRKNA